MHGQLTLNKPIAAGLGLRPIIGPRTPGFRTDAAIAAAFAHAGPGPTVARPVLSPSARTAA